MNFKKEKLHTVALNLLIITFHLINESDDITPHKNIFIQLLDDRIPFFNLMTGFWLINVS